MQVDQVDGSHRAVALFGHDELGEAAQIFAIAVINLFPENEADDVRVLLDAAAFAQIAELRAMIALPRLYRARLSCESTIMGTFISLPSSFMPRERALTS